jgi:methylmalonyl-CoA/ethylmalonyl-CoA epimerase
MIRGVHHLNFLVRDLDEAVDRYERSLGVEILRRDELPGRGVLTARFRAGDTWIVLVQPVADGEPMRYLERHGEGFYLISYEVDDVLRAAATARLAGVQTTSDAPRAGLDGWQIVDIDAKTMNGVSVQLCQDDSRAERQ